MITGNRLQANRVSPLGQSAPTRCPATAKAETVPSGLFFGSKMHEYERLKADWIAKNPSATPAEYQAAMTAIADALGV